MADGKTYTAKQNGTLFFQPGGPNQDVHWLGCYDVDDVEESRGEISLIQCFDESGNFYTRGFTEEAPDKISFGLGTFTGKRKELLESARCPSALYMMLKCRGKKNQFSDWDRVAVLDIAKVTGRTLAGWVKREEDATAMTSFTVDALPGILDVVEMAANRVQTAETLAINNVAFCNDEKCVGPCGPGQDICDEGFLVTDAAAAEANVRGTSDGGSTWDVAATLPFAATEHIIGAVCFPIDANTTRWLVARGVTDAGNPAEVAYSDDGGATWTNVDVGSTNGQFAVDSHALFALDAQHIWLATSGGYIYFSDDGGATWTTQEAGVITGAGNFLAVYFADEYTGMAVAVADDIAVTIDGGRTWSAATATGQGGDLRVVQYNGRYWWVATDDGDLFYSDDQGTTWSERTGFTGQGTGTIDAMDWVNPYEGWIGHNIGGAGFLLYTINGGRHWFRVRTATNTGLNQIYMCGSDLGWAVGEVQGGTAVILKIQPLQS
jgi:photosystem II stability/assembly factor-like uncharacterized protein